ncbi:energy transducer TonB [Puniceicoccaceae bacterium K14]|nr:energy transducer TonB [Puniceicoccaceae bacterium K14]
MANSKKSDSRFDDGYKPTKFNVALARAIAYAGASVLAIYVLLPFTQLISGSQKKVIEYREFDIAPPPPPSPPDLEEPPEPEVEEEPPPELREPPPPLDLAQLEMAMNPGIGDAQAAGLGFGGFENQPNALADLQLFDVKDLDERPKPIRQVKMIPPTAFKKERRDGLVRLEVMIDENGKTKVLNVVESSDRALEESAIATAEQWIWTPPKKNGEAVKARYVFPIGFRF